MGRSEMVGMGFVLFVALTWCTNVTPSADGEEVVELYDDLGPSRHEGSEYAIRTTRRDGIEGNSEWRSLVGESGEAGQKPSGGKEESWSCRESRRCKCTEAVQSRGVSVEDMRLLGEAFSADDELLFLQTQQTSRQQSEVSVAKSGQEDITKAAAAFSGYKWQKAPSKSRTTGDPSKPATVSDFHK